MVVFTCNHCGESLHKPKVAKHYQFQCKYNIRLTCVDCLEDFLNDEYISHTKCLTEAQRYGGKGYAATPTCHKGERKQEEWLNTLHKVLNSSSNLSEAERSFLQSISKHNNIPRKKAKYFNFVQNALGYRINHNIIESCWEKMEQAYKDVVQNKERVNEKCSKNGDDTGLNELNNGIDKNSNYNNLINNEDHRKETVHTDTFSTKKRKIEECNNLVKEKKQKTEEEIDVNLTPANVGKKLSRKKMKKKYKYEIEDDVKNENLDGNEVHSKSEQHSSNKFNWKLEIIKFVESTHEVSLKKLKKKVVKKYLIENSNFDLKEAESKFSKKLNKMTEVDIIGDKVKLKF